MNYYGNSVAVIDAATLAVIDTIPVGDYPNSFGVFIQSEPTFAGTPGAPDCYGKSVSVLAQEYGAVAAAVLGFPSVPALHDAITTFCNG